MLCGPAERLAKPSPAKGSNRNTGRNGRFLPEECLATEEATWTDPTRQRTVVYEDHVRMWPPPLTVQLFIQFLLNVPQDAAGMVAGPFALQERLQATNQLCKLGVGLADLQAAAAGCVVTAVPRLTPPEHWGIQVHIPQPAADIAALAAATIQPHFPSWPIR
ncbi:hypothetical protein WJX84_005899 [Apatococcus fuscideae]|uniref:Uncharacterized protein n=1 Tax=Apatococcus fuscideae TaxID=2026836 RepID=A0AAW1T1T0_9CHLO